MGCSSFRRRCYYYHDEADDCYYYHDDDDDDELAVDDSVGSGSGDTAIKEDDRPVRDRARCGPRMKKRTEATRRQHYAGKDDWFEGTKGSIGELVAMLKEKYAREKAEHKARAAGRQAHSFENISDPQVGQHTADIKALREEMQSRFGHIAVQNQGGISQPQI